MVHLGRTEILSDKSGFGALPVQRATLPEAIQLLQNAYDGGFTFFDTARAYSDSEEKLGLALSARRDKIHIATKTMAKTAEKFWEDLHTSLRFLKTDYVDIYQFHTPPFCPRPGDGTGLYEAMLAARQQGKIRFISITNHSLDVAWEAVESGLYDTLQFPFSYLSSQREIDLVQLCREKNVGFIAMKALSGGLITRSDAAYAWLDQYDNVLPIWGIQRQSELSEFLQYKSRPPALTPEIQALIAQDRRELSGSFCRGCGYCLGSCPAHIQINTCARMAQLIRRSPSAQWLSPENQAMMHKIEDCIQCGQCKKKCPYGLDIPTLLQKHLADYQEILAQSNP